MFGRRYAQVLSIATLFVICIFSPSSTRAQETAHFKLTFESTWSETSHPVMFPSNAHFSGLIGTTHNESVSFWSSGQEASVGIKDMAETGSKTSLISIFNDSDDRGTSDFRISGSGIGVSPGVVSVQFSAVETHPLLTIVSMLAPSPDWFVGVSGLSLRSGGTWVPHQKIILYTYDAGTDSGASYASANALTSPPSTIQRLEDEHMVVNGTVKSVGTFTITLENITGTSSENNVVPESFSAQVFPNPFQTQVTLEVDAPKAEFAHLEVFDLLGRKVDTIFSGVLSQGENRFNWNAHSAGPGVYWIQIRSATRVHRFSALKSN